MPKEINEVTETVDGVAMLHEAVASMQPEFEEAEPDEEAPEPTAAEIKASEMGWTPRANYKGDPLEFIEADEFIRRKPLFDKIHHEVDARKKVERKLDQTLEYFKKLSEKEYVKQLAELRARRQIALEEQDTATADTVNDEIVAITAERKEQEREAAAEKTAQTEALTAQNQAVLGNWMESNKWYNSDPALRKEADDIAAFYAKKYPSETLIDLLDYVDGKMAKKLPREDVEDSKEVEEEVTPPKAKRLSTVPKVSTGKQTTVRPAAKPKYTRANLTPFQRDIMDTFVRSGTMTEAQYIDSLVAIGEVA